MPDQVPKNGDSAAEVLTFWVPFRIAQNDPQTDPKQTPNQSSNQTRPSPPQRDFDW